VGRLSAHLGLLDLTGQIVVDVAQRPIKVSTADTHGTGIAGELGRQPIHLQWQIGSGKVAHICGQPTSHKHFDFAGH
jgi:hypothetical protein